MPCLKLLTNIPSSKIPKDFVHKLVPLLAKTLRKDLSKFVVAISGDCQVTFGDDSTLPAAAATLESVGNVSLEENRTMGRELSAFVHRELGVHPDRFFMSIYDIKGANIVKHGDTLHALDK